MADARITGITLMNITEITGFLGRNVTSQEQVRLITSGGSIYLRQSVVDAAGDNWKLFLSRLRDNAKQHGIPFDDER